MRFVSTFALGAMLALGTVAVAMPQPAAAQSKRAKAPKLNLGKPFTDAYNTALAQMQAGDVAGAKAAWEALPITSDDEKYQAGIMGLQLGQAANDQATQYKAVQMLANNSKTPEAEKGRFAYLQGALNPDAKAGLAAMTAAYEGGYRPDGINVDLANAYFKSGDVNSGNSWLQKEADRLAAAGQPFPSNYAAFAMNANLKARNTAGAANWGRRLIASSLAPQYWSAALFVARQDATLDSQSSLDLMRLQRTVNALGEARDYAEYVEYADARRLPGEVVTVLNEGKSKGILKGGETFATEALGIATPRVSADKASLANAERDAAAASAAIANGIGDQLLGYGEYARAATVYQTALGKSGADANRINTRLGIAKAGQGDLTGARANFTAVASGPWKTVASYWLAYLDAKANNAPTTVQ